MEKNGTWASAFLYRLAHLSVRFVCIQTSLVEGRASAEAWRGRRHERSRLIEELDAHVHLDRVRRDRFVDIRGQGVGATGRGSKPHQAVSDGPEA